MNEQLAKMEVVNMNEFQAVLNRYLGVCSRELPKALNAKMFYIARGAARLSPKASRPEVEKELGVVGYKVKVGKSGKPLTRKGKLRWNTVVSSTATLAAKIVNARRGKAGKPGLHGSEMATAVSRLIARRIAAIGTIRRGWRNAIKAFGFASGEASVVAEPGRVKGATKFKIAKDGFTPSAELEYLVNSYDRNHNQYIDARTRAALRQAYADEMRSMQEYIIKKLQKQADRLSR